MVPYKPHQQPGLSQWTGGAMQASIVLDQPGNFSFTNLDQISGRVVVRCTKSAAIDSILVKLEGESRTRLLSPQGPNGEKPKAQLEYHKVRTCLTDACDESLGDTVCFQCRYRSRRCDTRLANHFKSCSTGCRWPSQRQRSWKGGVGRPANRPIL